MNHIDPHSISDLAAMKKLPKHLSYIGDISLLERPRVSIVGTRKPSHYTKQFTQDIARELAKRGVVTVSGAAMGVDAMAHRGAGSDSTIAVLPSGIDIRYPAVNRDLIESIEREGLTLSQFEQGFGATSWSFVLRNEIVVALGDVLVVTEADEGSGSMRSVEYALQMGKDIFVLSHRVGESMGTNSLLRKGLVKPIYSVEDFVSLFGVATESSLPKDKFYYFCQARPTLDEAVDKFGSRVYEAELEGIVRIEEGRVFLS
ncbi:MAG: DNA-processing protein DprA [Sulfurovum sp.]|nr:DNA-processing protein DprA [Sulfurovum sp.]